MSNTFYQPPQASNVYNKAIIITFFLLVSSCANLNTLNRETDLGSGTKADPKAIHLDAKQRLVIQNKLGRICAEPAPDALSSLALSSSASIITSKKEKAEIASNLAESAASIGLRTQSIQLMRDALYRVCEMYYSGGLDKIEILAIHQKYQDTLLAVLAVEQLTGAIKAAPVTTTTSGSASSLSSTKDVIEQLVDTRESLSQSEAEFSELAGEISEAAATNDEYKKALEELENGEGNDEEIEKAKDDLAASTTTLEDLKKKKDNKTKEIEDLKDFISLLEQSRDASFRQAKTSTQSNAEVGEVNSVSHVNEETAQHIATAVREIVKTTSSKPYIAETCLSLVVKAFHYREEKQSVLNRIHEIESRNPKNASYSNEQRMELEALNEKKENVGDIVETIAFCEDILKVTAENYNQRPLAPSQNIDEEEEDAQNKAVLYFDSGSKLNQQHKYAINQLAEELKQREGTKVRIDGHSDEIGSDAAKLNMSRQRAEAVANQFKGYGIDPARISTAARSDKDLADKGNTPEAHQRNRRVEIFVR